MPGFLKSLANVFHRSRPKPADYGATQTQPHYIIGNRAPPSKDVEYCDEDESEDEPESYSNLTYDVFGPTTKHRLPIPIWPDEAPEAGTEPHSSCLPQASSQCITPATKHAFTAPNPQFLQAQWAGANAVWAVPPSKGPSRRVLKKQRRFKAHEDLGHNLLGIHVDAGMSRLDLPLPIIEQEKWGGFGAFQDIPEIQVSPTVSYEGGTHIYSTYGTVVNTPLSVDTNIRWTPLFDSPLSDPSVMTALTGSESPPPLPPKDVPLRNDGQGVNGEETTGLGLFNLTAEVGGDRRSVKRVALARKGDSRQGTEGSLEESIVTSAMKTKLESDWPQVQLVEEHIAGVPSLRSPVGEAVEADMRSISQSYSSMYTDEDSGLLALLTLGDGHRQDKVGMFRSDEADCGFGSSCSSRSLPTQGGGRKYPSTASSCSSRSTRPAPVTSYPSIPSVHSSSRATFAHTDAVSNFPSPHASPRQKLSSLRQTVPRQNSIPFPQLPDVEVPYKPGWIYYYTQGRYIRIPSSIPPEKRQVWADGCFEIYDTAAPALEGQTLTMEEWNDLLKAFDVSPFNWIQKPPVTGFRFLSELEVDMMLEFRATPINLLFCIFYGVHAWTRGESGGAESLAKLLLEALPRLGWDKGLPRRFERYLHDLGLVVRVSPDSVELLELPP